MLYLPLYRQVFPLNHSPSPMELGSSHSNMNLDKNLNQVC